MSKQIIIDSKLKGIFYVIMAAFGFSMMSFFVKLSGDLPAFQKSFFRNFVALIFISAIIIKNKSGFIPRKKSIPDLLCRCVFGTAGLLCNFYAIGHLNLSDANMLNKLSPFFAILFSLILLKEKPDIMQILGVVVAFGGSLLIIKPGFNNPKVIESFIGLLGGMGAGAAYTFVRRLGEKNENPNRIVFWFSAFSCVVCLPVMIFTYCSMSAKQLIFLLLAGAFACVGQIGITRAYLCAPAKEISVYDYTQVLFAALLGFLFLGDVPDIYSIVGYILICSAGVGVFLWENKKQRI